MPVHNSDIADIFATLADLLEIEGANPFRVRAYRNAAVTARDRTRLDRAQQPQAADLGTEGPPGSLAHRAEDMGAML